MQVGLIYPTARATSSMSAAMFEGEDSPSEPLQGCGSFGSKSEELGSFIRS